MIDAAVAVALPINLLMMLTAAKKIKYVDLVFAAILFYAIVTCIHYKTESFLKPLVLMVIFYSALRSQNKIGNYDLKNYIIMFMFLGYLLDTLYFLGFKNLIANLLFPKSYIVDFTSAVNYRRYIHFLDHRFFGATIDPLSWGLCHAMLAIYWYRNRFYLAFLLTLIVGVLVTESRITILYFVISFFVLFWRRVFGQSHIATLSVLTVVWMTIICLARWLLEIFPVLHIDKHFTGMALLDFNANLFWGVVPYVADPGNGFESGLLFVLSTFGVSALGLLIIFSSQLGKLSSEKYNMFVTLLCLLPVHYYAFNPVLLIFGSLIFTSKKVTT